MQDSSESRDVPAAAPRGERGRPGPLYSTTQIHHLMRVEFGRAQRYGYALSLLVLGLDEVERLRSTWGVELIGEAVEAWTRLVSDRTRGCDHLGALVDRRLVLVLPHTDRAGAEILAARLTEAVSDLGLLREGQPVPVTASAGISTFTDGNTMFFDALLESAESALVAARTKGGACEYCPPGDLL